MARYQIKDNQTGKTVTIEADSPPTEADAEGIFSQAGLRGQAQSNQVYQGNQGNQGQNMLQTILQKGQGLAEEYIPQTAGQYKKAFGAKDFARQVMADQTLSKEQKIQKLMQYKKDFEGGQLQAGSELAQYTPVTGQNFAGKALTGSLRGLSHELGKDETTPTQIAGSVAGYGAGEAIIGSILEKGGKYVSDALKAKTLNPTKIAGYLREQAATQTPNIETSKIIEAGERWAKLDPASKTIWDEMKTGIKENMPTKDLLDQLTAWGNRTWTMSGNVKDKAAAQLMKHIYSAGRESILSQAPNVAKYTASLKAIKELPGMVTAAQKGSWLLLKLLGIGKLI